MEVLRFNRKYFKILGLLWSAKNGGTIYRILKICVHAVYIFTYVTGPMSNVLYIYHHPNLLNAVSAFFLTGATCSGFGSYLGFILNEQNIKKLVRDLQDLVDNEIPEAVEMYSKGEQKCAATSKRMANAFIRLYTLCTTCPLMLHPIWCMFFGNFDTSTWFFPLSIDIPIDVSTPHGWYLRAFFHLLLGYTYIFTLTSVVPFFACNCIYIRISCQRMKLIFDESDEMISPKRTDYTTSFKQTDKLARIGKVHENMNSAVILHMKIARIFGLLSTICSSTICSFLLPGVILLASSLYTIEVALRKIGLELFFCVVSVMIGLVFPYVLCDSATQATFEIVNIAGTVYSSKWYNYPLNVRRHLILIMAQSQKPLVFRGLKIVSCSLEVFMKLINSALSYYIMFRSLSAR